MSKTVPPKSLDMVNTKDSTSHRKSYKSHLPEVETRRRPQTQPVNVVSQNYDQTNYKNVNAQHEMIESDHLPIESFSSVPETDPRHWAFLFQNLQTAIMRMYHTAQHDSSVDKCKEIMHFLQKYWRGFHALIDKITAVSAIQGPLDYDTNSTYKNNQYRSPSTPNDVRASTHFRNRHAFEDPISAHSPEFDESHKDQKNRIKQSQVVMEQHYKPQESEEVLRKPVRRDLADAAEESLMDTTNKPTSLSNKRPTITKHVSDIDQYKERPKSPLRRVPKKHSADREERTPEFYERSIEGKKLYEKLFPDSKHSKDIQREIDKFNEVLQRTDKYNEAFNDSDKDSLPPSHSKREVLDPNLDNIAQRSDKIFEYMENEAPSEHNSNTYESNEDENSEKTIRVEEAPQMDRSYFKNHVSNKSRPTRKQDVRSHQFKSEMSSSDPDSGSEMRQRKNSFVSGRKSNRSPLHSDDLVAEYELD